MSTTVKAGWLKDHLGNKFAPKTMSSQVMTNDGKTIEERINASIDEISSVIAGKSDNDHLHDDIYYTETEVDTKFSTVNTSISNIVDGTTIVGKSEEATHATSADSANEATHAASADLATKATQDGEGNSIVSTYETKNDSSAKLNEAKSYTDTHNTATDTHSDIRLLLTELSTKINNFLNIDDTTKDQLSEVIQLIENNETEIDTITTSKVNVADIVDNLTTNVSNKPLSAAQGVVLKGLINDQSGTLGTLTSIIDDKANVDHDHNSLYYTKTETGNILSQKSQVQIITWEADD